MKKDDVIEIPETTTTLPETTEMPLVCPVVTVDCTESDRAEILFPPVDSKCTKYAKLVVPIEMAIIDKIPVSDITEIMRETNPVIMLLKLLKLVEKCRLM